ncbi:MAG: hypothetical protein K2K84_04575 [Muribaculaceae bacterium]|nr:hypothetical protein [Muribaculaceae bacterium]
MNQSELKELQNDPDGLTTYEFLANNLDSLSPEDMDELIENMSRVDLSGQYLASGARYLNALDGEKYADAVRRMVALTIDRDRERNFIPDLLTALYGPDCAEHFEELSLNDNNFRRMYKRVYPNSPI